MLFFRRKKDYIDYKKLKAAIRTIQYNNECQVVSHIYYDLATKDIIVVASDSALGVYNFDERYYFFLGKFNHTTIMPTVTILENLIVIERKKRKLKV